MNLFLSLLISALFSWGLIPILIRYAPKLGMVDTPEERKLHSNIIPRCGGVAIFAGAITAILLLLPFNSIYDVLLVGSLIIVFFGIADDILELDYKWKFLGQICAVCFVISQGIYIKVMPFMGADEAPLLVSYTITFLFIVGATNAVNLSDGLDGLAAGIMLLSFSFIVLLASLSASSDIAVMGIAVIGGMIGFLRFNTHPATIFMGDAGSQFIGFMCVCLAILLTQKVTVALNPGLPLLIMGLPILDTLVVMVQRVRAGHSPFSSDQRHIHHKLLAYGFTHEQSVAGIYLIQTLFLFAAFYLKYAADLEVVGVYILISCSILVFLSVVRVGQWQFNVERTDRDRRRSWFRRYNHLFSFCRVYIEWSIITYLTFLLGSLLVFSKTISYIQALCFVLSVAVYSWLPIKVQNMIIRIAIYNSVLFGYFTLSEFPDIQRHIYSIFDIYFPVLLLVTLLAVSVTRREYFKLTTQDMLVVIFMIPTVFLLNVDHIPREIIYLFCLGYALEYLLSRDIYRIRLLRVLAFFCILNGTFIFFESNRLF